jgi:hypothetical protein
MRNAHILCQRWSLPGSGVPAQLRKENCDRDRKAGDQKVVTTGHVSFRFLKVCGAAVSGLLEERTAIVEYESGLALDVSVKRSLRFNGILMEKEN